MALTNEQEWTLVACGLIAHADDRMEVGEWQQLTTMLQPDLDAEETERWCALLSDRAALEERFQALEPPAMGTELLRSCWRMALADGAGSDVEVAVHDRIAERVGVDLEQAQVIRDGVDRAATQRAVLILELAAALANLDGRLDIGEASAFDNLLERAPLPVSRQLDMAGLLHEPPELDRVVERLSELSAEERLLALSQVVPMIRASARGEQERAAFLDIAGRLSIEAEHAQSLLG